MCSLSLSIYIYILYAYSCWSIFYGLSQFSFHQPGAAQGPGLQEVEPGVEGTQLSNEIQQFQKRPAVNGPVVSLDGLELRQTAPGAERGCQAMPIQEERNVKRTI